MSKNRMGVIIIAMIDTVKKYRDITGILRALFS